ncbi:dipeptide/oligopeptide/nickel ABC transporter permease/ATP-binding protein [Candidatus Poriferisodalis sp.]|uniref:dipeptide/oligopeptide/nickel ABC transporter permease/ATP-binding protein n=1 Tax=Candidatus Poriferisodalis sp. TaxID=3101277 RepID=UPI003B020287
MSRLAEVPTAAGLPGAAESAAGEVRGRFWVRLRRNKVAVAGAVYLVLTIIAAVFAPVFTSHDETFATRFQDVLFSPGEAGYLLGTDHVGRDILTRLFYGARYALIAGVEAVLVALVIGVPLGLVIGYFRGWVDRVAMRLVETVVAVPAVVMAMAIITGLGTGLTNAMLAIGLVYSMIITRLTRAEVFAAREEFYVDGARAAGASDRRVMWRHILPNIAPPLIVQTTLLFAQAVLAEAALSFLGIGADASQASWGRMLRDAELSIDRTIWPAIPPGVAIFLTVVAFNVFGDGLRDAFAREARGGRVGVGDVLPRLPSLDRPSLGQPSLDRPSLGQPSAAAPPRPPEADVPLLSLRGLDIVFPKPGEGTDMTVVRGVDLDIGRGEVVALVGESGSGKTITGLSLMGLVPDPGQASAVSIMLDGKELVGMDFGELRRIRGRDIGIVFQEPSAALNPAYTVGRQVAEPLRVHLGMSKRQARERVIELFAEVGIPDPRKRIDAYPHQFSGGMAQRVMIAMALSCEPKLLIADEPTTALDVTVQGQMLDLIGELAASRGVSVLLITHDLGVVADLADRVAVMYAGEIVETGRLDDVFARPRHPYTEGLIAAIPRNEPRSGDLPTIPGVVPPPWEWPERCHFADRCRYETVECRRGPVDLRSVGVSLVRCERSHELELQGVQRGEPA